MASANLVPRQSGETSVTAATASAMHDIHQENGVLDCKILASGADKAQLAACPGQSFEHLSLLGMEKHGRCYHPMSQETIIRVELT